MQVEVKRVILEAILNVKQNYLIFVNDPPTADVLEHYAYWIHKGKIARASSSEVDLYFTNKLSVKRLIEISQDHEPERWAPINTYLSILNHDLIDKLERILNKT